MHFKIDKSLLRHSSIILTATVIGGLFNYLFQLYMGRALSPEGYGEFSALVSLLYITSVPAGTIVTTIALFASEYKAKSEYGKLKFLLIDSIKKLFIFGLLGFILIGIASSAISSFLNIGSNIPVLIIGLIFLISAVYQIAVGTLQGLQNFTQAGLNGILAAAFKLVFGVLFVYFGLGVNGALLALFVSPLLAFLFALIPLRFISKTISIRTKNREILKYSLPVLITLLVITLISNIDVVLVKHYFSAADTGYYSAASLLSKIIFFVTGAIATVMFPKVSELHIRKEKTIEVLRNSLFYTFMITAPAIFIYWFSPAFVVGMLFGREYAGTTEIIGLFGVALMFFSLAYIIIMYSMAVKNFRFLYIITGVLLLEVLVLSSFHDTLFTVVKILAILFIMLFTGMALVVPRK
ncbi:MAG: oligosaccharide flippase family protein [Candidatus Methanoperedens sp.]|nr:oligosaccharide flippase family protein [Candidatus Methanoperedens sp.]